MLRGHGLDPDKIKADINKAKADREDIMNNYDGKLEGFKELWIKWILQYK